MSTESNIPKRPVIKIKTLHKIVYDNKEKGIKIDDTLKEYGIRKSGFYEAVKKAGLEVRNKKYDQRKTQKKLSRNRSRPKGSKIPRAIRKI